MTLSEFKNWLDGYIEGGGKNVEAVKQKLNSVVYYEPIPGIRPLYLPDHPNTKNPFYPFYPFGPF